MSERKVDIEHIACAYTYKDKPQRIFVVPKGENVVSHGIRMMSPHAFAFTCGLYERAVREGGPGSFFDIGANFGTTSVLAGDFFSKIYGFEIEPVNCAIFSHAMQLNRIPHELHHRAVSDKAGDVTAFRDTENLGGHSLLRMTAGHKFTFQVPAITLDDFNPSVTDARFVHIDTEGHDLRVLKGAHAFFRRQKTRPFVEIEFMPAGLKAHGSTIADLFHFMDEFGYTAHMNATNVHAPLSRTVLSDLFDSWSSTAAMLDLLLLPT